MILLHPHGYAPWFQAIATSYRLRFCVRTDNLVLINLVQSAISVCLRFHSQPVYSMFASHIYSVATI